MLELSAVGVSFSFSARKLINNPPRVEPLYGVTLGTVSKSFQQISGLKTRVVELGLRMGSLGLSTQFQGIVIVLISIWAAFSASALILAVWPASNIISMPSAIMNPAIPTAVRNGADEVVLEGMLGLGLFGVASDFEAVNNSRLVPEPEPRGIENGARDTQLDLKLVGTLAGSEADEGTAVIEVKGKQATFAVGDELPISARVRLAKVLPTRVVLDNNGTYELLNLFEDSALSLGPVEGPVSQTQPSKFTGTDIAPVRALKGSERGTQLAADYREKFYDKPQSVSELLTIQPVRGSDGLRGYRVTPAKNVDDFTAIGFEPGDLITGVNGLSLLDASNGARLYGLMRDAQEVTFDIEREGAPLTLTVTLQSGSPK